jgi:hypothetical protein
MPTRDGFDVLMECLSNCLLLGEDLHLVAYFFRQVLTFSLNRRFFSNLKSVSRLCKFFIKCTVLDKSSSPEFVGFLRAVLIGNNRQCCETALDTLWQLLDEKREIIDVENVDEIINLCLPGFHQIDVCYFKVLILMCQVSKSHMLTTAFSNIASGLFEFVEGNYDYERIENESESFPSPVIVPVEPFAFEFFESKNRYFENGLTSLHSAFYDKIHDIADFLSPIIIDKIGILRQLLSLSKDSHVSVFITNLRDLISGCTHKVCALVQMAIYFLLFDSISDSAVEMVKFGNDIPYIIFNQEQLLYTSDGLPPFLSSLRNSFLDILIRKRPHGLAAFLRLSAPQPYLFAELIGRILMKSDRFRFDNLLSADFLRDLVNLAAILQRIKFTNELAVARTIVFEFMFELVKYGCLEKPLFVYGFLKFLFEPEISSEIIRQIHIGAGYITSCEALLFFFKQCFISILNHSSDNQYGHLLLVLVRTLNALLRTNTQFSSSVVICFDALIHTLLFFPSIDLLLELIDHFSLCDVDLLSGEHLGLVSTFVREQFSEDRLLVDKIFALTSLGRQPFSAADPNRLLFSRPKFLPFLLACFGNSSIGTSLVSTICQHSLPSFYNLCRCHDCDLDFILASFLSDRTDPLFYDGMLFDLKFDDEMRQSTILPLLFAIASISSSFAVIHRLTSSPGDAEITELLMAAGMRCRTFVGKTSPLGFSASAEITGLHADHFRLVATLSFRVQIDLPAARALMPSVHLLTISDSEGRFLKLEFHDPNIFLRYNDENVQTIIMVASDHLLLQSSQVILIISRGDENANENWVLPIVGRKKDREIEMCRTQFVGELKIEFGGQQACRREDCVVGFIDDFMFCPRELNDDEILDLCDGIHPSDALELVFRPGYTSRRAFADFLSDKAIALIMLENDRSFPIEVVLSMLRQFAPALLTLDFMINVLLTHEKTAELYFCIYSLFTAQTTNQNEWFERIVFNFHFWSACDSLSLECILSHSNAVIVQHCWQYLTVISYFGPLLTMFETIFPASTPVNDTNRILYLILLKKLAIVNFTESDEETLLSFCCSTEDPTFALVYLELLRDLITKIQTIISQRYLWGLVQLAQRMRRSDVVALILIVLSDLPCSISAILLWTAVVSSVDLPDLFACIRDNLSRRPKLFEYACCIALELSVSVGSDLLALLGIPNASIVIGSLPHWYFFPLLIVLQTENETEMIQLLQFIAAVAGRSIDDIRTIGHLLAYLVPLLRTSQISDPLSIFLAEVGAFSREAATFEAIQALCSWNLLFHKSTRPTNAALAAEWSASPFSRRGQQPPEFQPISIKSFNDLVAFLGMPMSFDLNVGIMVAPDGTSAQPRLELVLNALRDVCSRSRESALAARFLDHQTNNAEIPHELQSVRIAFLDQWQMVVVSTLAEIRSVVQMVVPPALKGNIQNTESILRRKERKRCERLSTLSRRTAFSLQRSSAICRGFPVARTRQPVLDEIGPEGLRGNCTISILFHAFECRIATEGKTLVMLFLRSQENLCISFNKLSEIFVRSDLVFEIWTMTKRSFLISLHEPPNLIVPALPICPQKLDRTWHSNFDYLLWLNRMSGRSFNDPTCYPVFPSFIDNLETPDSVRSLSRADFCEPKLISQISNLAHELERSSYVAAEFYCDPDGITLALPSWAGNTHEFVYKMRKLLESSAVTALLPSWIGKVWGPGMSPRVQHARLFPGTFPQRPVVPIKTGRKCHMVLSDLRIAFAFREEEYLCTVNARGNVLTYTFVDESCVPVKEEVIEESLRDVEFYPNGHSLFMYTREKCKLVELGKGRERHLSFEKGLFCRSGKGYIFCQRGCEIWNTDKHIASSCARIVAFAVNRDFGRLVYGTAEGNLHFLTLTNGSEVAQAHCDGLIDSILITREWGLVIVRGGSAVRVFSVNGEFLKQADLPSKIVCWSTFTSYRGFDFIAFGCLFGDVGLFEAFFPGELRLCHRCPDAILVFYEREASRLMILKESGVIDWVTQELEK